MLKEFEEEIAQLYENGEIKAPVHLRDGNEEILTEIFRKIKSQDYVFSTWASHLHCLLKGVPPERVRQDILDGRSITLHYPEYNFSSSAIVGGIAPIAVGTAKALQMSTAPIKNEPPRVFAFVGDMALNTGIVNESIRYSIGHDLPITWVVEDNGKSVGTETEETCGIKTKDLFDSLQQLLRKYSCCNVELIYYSYKTSYPHSGTGVFVEF